MLEAEIEAILDQVNSELTSPPRPSLVWTFTIKSRLAELGLRNGYDVCASGASNSRFGEWLYDLCWLLYDHENLVRMELVLESEWGKPDDVYDDFQKLCQCRASLRVLIFAAKNLDHFQLLIARLKTQIAAYSFSLRGDRYLLSCWLNSERKFRHEQVS